MFKFNQGGNFFTYFFVIPMCLLALLGGLFLVSKLPATANQNNQTANTSYETYTVHSTQTPSVISISLQNPAVQSLTPDQYRNGHWHTVYVNGQFGVGMWDANKNAFHMIDGSPDVQPGPSVIVYAHVDETELVAGSWYWECSIPNYAIKFVGGMKVEGDKCFIGQFRMYDSTKGYFFTTESGETIVLESTHGGFPFIK